MEGLNLRNLERRAPLGVILITSERTESGNFGWCALTYNGIATIVAGIAKPP